MCDNRSPSSEFGEVKEIIEYQDKDKKAKDATYDVNYINLNELNTIINDVLNEDQSELREINKKA